MNPSDENKIERYILALDPGKNGAYCILNDRGGIFDMQPMPPMETLQRMAEWCKDPIRHVTVMIEDVTPNASWRLKSCWTFAQHVGQLHLIFPNCSKVYPRTWQKAMWVKNVLGDAKAKSLQTARFYVDEKVFIGPGKRTPHDGCVDAYLIARYTLAQMKMGVLK